MVRYGKADALVQLKMQSVADTYRPYLGRRYKTIKWAFHEFTRIGGTTVVELGTIRSFVTGGVTGCMVNDEKFWHPNNPEYWDWGAGMFTRICAEYLRGRTAVLHTVDISSKAIEISKVTTRTFENVTHYLEASESFLNRFSGKIDFLYMDAGESAAGADELHFREAKIVVERQLMSHRGIVLVDDVNIPGSQHSKGRLSIPFLCTRGFEIKLWDYQVILQTACKPDSL